MTSRFLIEIESLRYAYRKGGGKWVLDDIHLKISPDEYLLICGASGSGKSTLCRVFNGLIPHFFGGKLEGNVRIAGVPIMQQSISSLFATLGMVFQNPETQLFNRTVEREIAFGLESIGVPAGDIKSRIAQAVDAAGIDALLDRNPHELSGGEQQLVVIAAVLALQPRMIILDEPYANLDPANVRRVRGILQKIHQNGTGIIIGEHRLALTAADAKRMLVLHEGRIVRDGSPDKVLSEDVEAYGLETPLAVDISRRMGLTPLALEVEDLKTRVSRDKLQSLAPPAPGLPFSLKEGERVLTLDGITFQLNGRPILRDVSFTLDKGECLALVGANGAGKTTLLKHLNGLNRPAGGDVVVLDRPARGQKVSQLARFVGVAFQNPNSQFFKLTVWDEIVVGANALHCYDEAWIRELVELFALGPLLQRAPYRLSEGEKKRVAFAAALAARPAILALDEPTAGQDMFFRRSLRKLLADLCRRGQAVLLITQDLSFAEECALRWILLAQGEIVAEGLPDRVMGNRAAMERARLEPTDRFRLLSG